jgi:hypothetical protein
MLFQRNVFLSGQQYLIVVRVVHFVGDFLPRLVKGGKCVYGWSEVNGEGKVVVFDAALEDYSFRKPVKFVLLSGSRRSGGLL